MSWIMATVIISTVSLPTHLQFLLLVVCVLDFWTDGILLPVDPEFQAPRPYRPGYSESEATSDDSCYRPRPPTSFRLSPSSHPEVNNYMHFAHHPIQFPVIEFLNNQALFQVFSEASSGPSRPSSLAWDNYDSGPRFQPPAAFDR